MPAVATQTGWSWLQDLREIEALAEASNVDFKQLSGFSSISDFTENRSNKSRERTEATAISQIQDSANSQCTNGIDSGTDVKLKSINVEDHEIQSSSVNSDLVLPPLVSGPGSSTYEPVNTAPTPTDNHLPPIFQQLEQFSFSEQETDERSSGDDTEDEDSTRNTESITMDEIDLHMEKYDKLRSAGKEPGLTILQYLKESESRYYEYFSMKNKDEVDKRINEARVKSPRAEEVGMQSELTTCQFCGKTIPKMSLLQVIQEDNEEHITDKKVIFCCESYSEYMVLVAMCMRRKVEEAKNPPKQRPAKPKKKPDKKAMELKALAIISIQEGWIRWPLFSNGFGQKKWRGNSQVALEDEVAKFFFSSKDLFVKQSARRKQKWEEMQERKRMEAEALRRQRKGLETIKFTLLDSDSAVEKGWAVRPESRVVEDARTTKKKRKESRFKKEKTVTPQEMFLPETLERLQLQAPVSGNVSITMTGTFLPDGTGLCRYPSGNSAVVVLSPYAGVLSYMVYEDSQYPQLLCCFDELGRACCHFANGNIRFLSSQNFMAEYDFAGRTEKTSISGGGSPGTDLYYKPRSFKLNKYITLKCSKGLSRLIVNFPRCQLKFNAPCKLHKDELPVYAAKLHEQTVQLESQLATIRDRIDEVKRHLPTTRPSRVGRLLPLHGSPMNRRSRQRAHIVSNYK